VRRKRIPEEAEPWAHDRLMDVEGERLRMATQLPSLLTTLISKLLKSTNLLNTPSSVEEKTKQGGREGGSGSFWSRLWWLRGGDKGIVKCREHPGPFLVQFHIWRRIYGLPRERSACQYDVTQLTLLSYSLNIAVNQLRILMLSTVI